MEKLRRHILSANKETGQKWLDQLPELIRKCSQHWQIENVVPFNNLSWNYVARGIRSGEQIVLKIGLDIGSLQREVSALKTFSPASCVAVIDFHKDLGAVLLEAADPGKDLMSHQFNDPFAAVTISCDVAKNICSQQTRVEFSFDRIADLFHNFDQSWSQIPSEMLQLARDLRTKLIFVQAETYVIHGDLHRENILSHNMGWRAIDPKGYIGTLYSEVWPFIHEPKTEIPFAAQKLGLDEKLLFKWCFMHAILSTTWCLEDGVDPKNILGLGAKIFPLLK